MHRSAQGIPSNRVERGCLCLENDEKKSCVGRQVLISTILPNQPPSELLRSCRRTSDIKLGEAIHNRLRTCGEGQLSEAKIQQLQRKASVLNIRNPSISNNIVLLVAA